MVSLSFPNCFELMTERDTRDHELARTQVVNAPLPDNFPAKMEAATSTLSTPAAQPAPAPAVAAATTAPAVAQSNGQSQTQPPQPPTQGLAMPPTAPDAGRALRKRAPTNNASSSQRSLSPEMSSKERERTTRSGTNFANRPKWVPKLKLKVSDSADGRRQSYLGPYDRDLDSEDEDLVFEEHFILKMPPGKDCDRIRDLVHKRQNAPDIWFKFKGAFSEIIWHQVPNQRATEY
jgi:transcription initiation factor TFIID subunit 7